MTRLPPMKPCPFCGGEAWLNNYEAKYSALPAQSRCPQCRSCGANIGYLATADKAIEAWNCRPEVIQLSNALVAANANHENFERLWYLEKDKVDRLKLAICGGEDVPGAIETVSVEDCEKFISEERTRRVDSAVGFDGGSLTLGALERARDDYERGFKGGRVEEFRTIQPEYNFKAEDEWFEHVLSDGGK